MSTSTKWSHSSKDGLTEVRISFEDGDGRNIAVVLHEVAHVILRAQPRGYRAAVHGPRYLAVEDKLLRAFNVERQWNPKTGKEVE